MMADDELRPGGGRCAQLLPETCAKLAASLPEGAATRNPLDLGVNAYAQPATPQCLKTVLADPGVNAALVVHAPTATTASEEIAQAVIGVARELSSARILPAGSARARWSRRDDSSPRPTCPPTTRRRARSRPSCT
ncbi:MAG: hypothetical protein M5U30_18820 [Burkholderiaceae bacterium]|nr:hypothetical protein [Burkholderiaceae bacterium]